MIELPLLKHCLRGHFLMKLIIKVKMSNKRSEMFNFFSSLQSHSGLRYTKHLIAIFLFSLC